MPFPIGKTTRRATLAGLALGIAAGLAPQAVMAQGWPSARPITMLNPFRRVAARMPSPARSRQCSTSS